MYLQGSAMMWNQRATSKGSAEGNFYWSAMEKF